MREDVRRPSPVAGVARRLRTPGRGDLVRAAAIVVALAAGLLAANYPFNASGGMLLPRKAPAEIVLLGVVFGAVNSMVALGLVLTYRAGKYINFAQGGPGAAGVVVTAKILQVFAWQGAGLYLLAGLAGFLTAGILAVVVEVIVFQLLRFFGAPRLIVTAVTLGLLGVFATAQFGFSSIEADKFQIPLTPSLATIGHVGWSLQIGLIPFNADRLAPLVIVPLAVLALGAFLRFTDFGSAIQAAAENSDRARLVGIPVRFVHTAVWGIAGLLSGLTALLAAPLGLNLGSGGAQLFVLALAPAVVAGMNNLAWTVVVSIVLGIVESIATWNYGPGPLNLVLFAIVLAALLLHPRLAGRTTEGEERSFGSFARVRPFPRELSGLAWLQVVRAGLQVAVVAAAALLPITFDLERQLLAEQVLLFLLAGLSLTLLTGFAGQVSLGQWAIVGAGALFGGWLATAHHLDFWLGLGIVGAGGGLLAALTGLPALRVRGLFLGASTLAMALAASDFAFRLPFFQVKGSVVRPWVGPFDLGAIPTQPGDEMHYYWFCLAVVVLALLLIRSFRRSRWGRSIVAVRDNERAAMAYAISPIRAKLLAFTLSGTIAAVAGYLLLYSNLQVDGTFFPVELSLTLFAAVVIGGLGSPMGAVLGALFFQAVQYFVPVPQVQSFFTTTGMILILAFMPGGLTTLAFGIRDRALRWIARREGIVVPSLVADERVLDSESAEQPLVPVSVAMS